MGSREYFHKQSLVGRRAEVRVMARDTVRFGGGLPKKQTCYRMTNASFCLVKAS